MKKLFTFALMALLTFSGEAMGQTIRRTWDFTKGFKSTTIENLTAAGWTVESEGAIQCNGRSAGPLTCKVNGEDWTVPETSGLTFHQTSAKHIVFAYDRLKDGVPAGGFVGSKFLWLNGNKAQDAITINQIPAGENVTIKYESHKTSEDRGFKVVSGNFADAEGNKTFTSHGEVTTVELINGETEMSSLKIQATNGFHIYSIVIGEGDPSKNTKIAYLYNGTEDAVLTTLQALEETTVTPVNVTAATISAEQLREYDVTIVGTSVPTDNANVAAIKEAIAWTPIINMNAKLYPVWGYGEAVNTENVPIRINDEKNALFKDIPVVEVDETTNAIVSTINVWGIKNFSDYFDNDPIIGTDLENSGITTIHTHNINRNAYIYIPDGNEALLKNAIEAAVDSKTTVSAASKPTFSYEYGDMQTTITINSPVPGKKIYYTIDGSDPTKDNVYSEPVLVNSPVTIKAMVEGDGYLMSDIAEEKVILKHQAMTPTISVSQHIGEAVVTLESEEPGVSIFYNYDNHTDSTKSTKYTAPFSIMRDHPITVFAGSEVLSVSKPAQQTITIETPILFGETMAHMDAAKDPYYDKEYNLQQEGKAANDKSDSKVAYFFSWGKSKTAYPFYNKEADPISFDIDEETGDQINVVYPKNPEEKFDFDNGWAVRSRGQIVCTEITIKPGKDYGNSSSYNPATVDDLELDTEFPRTDFYINLSEWNTSDPRSAMIYTTQKFFGPFAIISYISNGNSGTGPRVVFETGKDIEGDAVETVWDQVGDTCNLDQSQRLYRRFVRVYTGNEEVYVRARIADGGSKAGFYDIYITAMDPESPFITGIKDIRKCNTAAKQGAIYSISGARQQSMKRGLNIVIDELGNAKKVMVK